MSNVLITNYQFGWNPKTKQGAIQIKLQNGNVIDLPVATAEEFSALSMILKQSPIFLATENGYIATAEWEPVG